jgi:hypothetical protein
MVPLVIAFWVLACICWALAVICPFLPPPPEGRSNPPGRLNLIALGLVFAALTHLVGPTMLH